MLKYLKISGIVIFGLFTLSSFGFCVDESFTITTYYPSPYGVYKNLRLYPNDDSVPEGPCLNVGEMYYDNSEQTLYICSDGTWKPAPGRNSVIPSGMIAMFDTACPAGWNRFWPLDGKVARGSTTYGDTGGSETHLHTITTNTIAGPPGAFFGLYSSVTNTGFSSSWPPYLNVVWCKKGPPHCPNSACESPLGENCSTCPADCGACGGE